MRFFSIGCRHNIMSIVSKHSAFLQQAAAGGPLKITFKIGSLANMGFPAPAPLALVPQPIVAAASAPPPSSKFSTLAQVGLWAQVHGIPSSVAKSFHKDPSAHSIDNNTFVMPLPHTDAHRLLLKGKVRQVSPTINNKGNPLCLVVVDVRDEDVNHLVSTINALIEHGRFTTDILEHAAHRDSLEYGADMRDMRDWLGACGFTWSFNRTSVTDVRHLPVQIIRDSLAIPLSASEALVLLHKGVYADAFSPIVASGTTQFCYLQIMSNDEKWDQLRRTSLSSIWTGCRVSLTSTAFLDKVLIALAFVPFPDIQSDDLANLCGYLQPIGQQHVQQPQPPVVIIIDDEVVTHKCCKCSASAAAPSGEYALYAPICNKCYDDLKCSVCNDHGYSPENPLVLCDSCGWEGECKNCYGFKEMPDVWRCNTCMGMGETPRLPEEEQEDAAAPEPETKKMRTDDDDNFELEDWDLVDATTAAAAMMALNADCPAFPDLADDCPF
jgi:hypothetical protein